jgi:hypothetical protein
MSTGGADLDGSTIGGIGQDVCVNCPGQARPRARRGVIIVTGRSLG